MDDDIEFSDNLLPMDSSMLPRVDEEQLIEEQTERGEFLAAAPLINSLLEWFDEEIALADSIDGLDLESGVSLEAQVLARQLLKAKLMSTRSNLEVKKDSFLPQYKH